MKGGGGGEKPMVLSKNSDKEFVDAAVGALDAWFKLGAADRPEEHALPECNSFLRKYLRQELVKSHPDVTLESRSVGRDRWRKHLVALALTERQRTERLQKQREEKEQQLLGKLGFQRVFKAMVASKRPVV